MNILLIILRIVHIVAGILWAGGAAAYYLFLEPTAKATAPESQKFMDYLMARKRFSIFLNAMSLLTILAGGALYYRIASVNWEWIATGTGIGFTIGALAGISAVAAWNLLVPPPVEKLGKLAGVIQAGGGLASREPEFKRPHQRFKSRIRKPSDEELYL
ncbi:MAG TPA: hypothetical protein VI524_08805 [Anaerolineales bacterium]|nr:hypothetical protein [Anaerolineales bacterium]